MGQILWCREPGLTFKNDVAQAGISSILKINQCRIRNWEYNKNKLRMEWEETKKESIWK